MSWSHYYFCNALYLEFHSVPESNLKIHTLKTYDYLQTKSTAHSNFNKDCQHMNTTMK